MVSFSNYNLKYLAKKKITYGKFGIAFKEDWVKRNSINPVIYMNNMSFASSGLDTLLKARRSTVEMLPAKVRLAIIKLKYFTKNTKGYNSYTGTDDFNFKSENEWRFVPNKKQIGRNRISLSASAFEEDKNKYNEMIKGYPLRFNKEDIKYIYVDQEYIKKFESSFRYLGDKIQVTPWEYDDCKKT